MKHVIRTELREQKIIVWLLNDETNLVEKVITHPDKEERDSLGL